MRIRSIKPEFFKDAALAHMLSPVERLFYIGLWGCADANGVMEDDPRQLKAEILPYDTLRVGHTLRKMATRGLLVRYNRSGKGYIWLRNFRKHQRITGKERDGGGRYPMPPPELQYGKQVMGQIVGETPGQHLGKQEQGAGNREQGEEGRASTGSSVYTDPACPPTPIQRGKMKSWLWHHAFITDADIPRFDWHLDNTPHEIIRAAVAWVMDRKAKAGKRGNGCKVYASELDEAVRAYLRREDT